MGTMNSASQENLSDEKQTEAMSLDNETRMITDALKRHGANTVFNDENKSLEILAAIIYQKYYKHLEKEKEEPSNKTSKVWTALKFLMSIAVVLSLFGVNFSSFFSEIKSQISGNFDFKTGDNLTSRKFFGKEDVFQAWMKLCMKSIEAIYSDKTKEELDEDSIYTKLNYVLFGPPGTGKTFFVQLLAKRLDLELRKAYLEEIADPEYLKLTKEEEKREYIKKQPSRVWFCEVQPGDINGKHVGESESNVKLLFDEAKNLIKDKRWMICILFFDEGDVFFNQRTGGGDAGAVSASNVKSELLTKIGVIRTERYIPLFVFTATNRMEDFDDAFKRRFNHHCKFGNLSFNERREFAKFLLEDFKMENDELSLVAHYTANKSQAFIAEKMKTFIEVEDSTKRKKFYYRKYIDFLRENEDNVNMI